MINGALTVGTLDGANVEMSEAVGSDNIFIFGLRAEEVDELWTKGYNSSRYYNTDEGLRRIIETLIRGFNGESFSDMANYLLTARLSPIPICAWRIMNPIGKRSRKSNLCTPKILLAGQRCL